LIVFELLLFGFVITLAADSSVIGVVSSLLVAMNFDFVAVMLVGDIIGLLVALLYGGGCRGVFMLVNVIAVSLLLQPLLSRRLLIPSTAAAVGAAVLSATSMYICEGEGSFPTGTMVKVKMRSFIRVRLVVSSDTY